MTAVAAPPRRLAGPVPVDGSRARLDAGVRQGGLVALWASLLLVAYWWATGGGIQALAGWAAGLTSTGRLTGLLASDLLLVQLLLMARVPLFEHAFGQDRLARIHRFVGFSSFTLMLAYVGLIPSAAHDRSAARVNSACPRSRRASRQETVVSRPSV